MSPKLTSRTTGVGGNFIYPMIHHFILYYQQASERTWYQFERDATVDQRWKATFRRRDLLYLCCVDLFTIFVFLFQIYLLLSQRECFARRYWLTCRPITRQSTQMLREASEQDLCFSTSCYKALHGFTSDFHVLVLKWISVVRVRFLICCLFVIAVLIVSSIIHRYSEYINRTVTVHAITSTSSAYVVENTKIIKDQKDVYRR